MLAAHMLVATNRAEKRDINASLMWKGRKAETVWNLLGRALRGLYARQPAAPALTGGR